MRLVQPYVAGTQQQVVAPLFDPRRERELRVRFRRQYIPELERANSLFISNGRWPARAWVLLLRSDYLKFNLYATNLQLTIDDFLPQTGPALTFKNLAFVQGRCVSEGGHSDPNSVYLAELTDPQGVVASSWFSAPTTSQYNVRSPAYPQQFYQGSLNGSTPWTWDGMVGDLWGQLPQLGAYPGLPVAPTGTPEGWAFIGTSAWGAINQILDLLGMSVSTDLTKATNPYGIVVGGAADANFSAQQTKYKPLLEDDWEYIDGGSGRVPGSVVVYGHRRNDQYGTEETVRRDLLQWQETPFYSTTVNAPATFSKATGKHHLWIEQTVRFDVDGNALAADVTAFNAAAAERVTQYYQQVFRGTQGFMRQVYAGAVPFATGSLVDGVRWRMTFDEQGRGGWRTELVRGTGSSPAWEEMTLD